MSLPSFGLGASPAASVNAYQFPVGTFASFNLDLAIKAISSGTNYPVNYLTLDQVGSQNLVLSPAVSQFSVTNAAWTAQTLVTISIPSGVPSDDGTVLVGNLRIAAPGSAHLDTTTNVQVKIKLVHPTTCLKLYHFLTDQSFTEIVTSTDVNINSRGKITATTPYGQLSDNVLVVNTCSASQTFDLGIVLDSHFSTNPSGNPGNAVFTYFASGDVDPSTFDIADFGAGTGQGQSLQLTNITVPPGEMFLATVHIGINTGVYSIASNGTFGFSASVFVPGTTTLFPAVDPANPATATLTYTLK